MAVFLLKTEHGSRLHAARLHGRLRRRHLPLRFRRLDRAALRLEASPADAATNPLIYCPGSSVTRGQMAVFLVKTFRLM